MSLIPSTQPWDRQPDNSARLRLADGLAWASGLPAGRTLLPADGSRIPCAFTSNSAGSIPSAAGLAFVGNGGTCWTGDRSLTSTIGAGDFAFLFVLTMGSTGTQLLIGDAGGSTLLGVNSTTFYSYRGSFAGPSVTVGSPQVVLWTRVAGVEYIYANSAVTSAAAAASFASSGVTNLLCRASAGDYPATCSVALAACWPNRGFTASQARAVIANPWDAVYEPRRILVPVSAGGGAYTLTAEQGSYTLTGQAAGLLAGRVLAAAQGSYTLSGQAAALLKGNVLTAAQGSYALTGQDVGLLRGLLLSAAQGSYALSGQDATLTYTPLGAFSLTADQGSYTLTGQSASLLWGPVLAAGQGSYTLNGQDATLTYTPVGAYILTAGQGSYSLTGQDVLLQWGHVLAAAQGSYTLTGQDVSLARGLVMAAAQGSYTLSGQAAAFARTYVMSAGYGSYALTGQIVSLSYSGAALEALEYLLLISHITQSMSKTSKVTMEVDLISRI